MADEKTTKSTTESTTKTSTETPGQGKTSTQRAQDARQSGDKETAQREHRQQHAASSNTEHFGVKTEDDVELVNSDAVTRDQLQRDYTDDPDSRFLRDDEGNVTGVRGPDQLSPTQQYDAETLEERYNPEGREVRNPLPSSEAGRE